MGVHKNAERITALIANPKTPWSEQDRVHLEAQSDERLTTLEAAANPPEAPPAPKPEITLADLPEAWRRAIEAQAAQEAQERNTTVETLAAAQSVFTKAELEKMPTEQLKKMATLAGAPQQPESQQPTSFAARMAAARGSDNAAPPPIDFNAVIRAAQKKQ